MFFNFIFIDKLIKKNANTIEYAAPILPKIGINNIDAIITVNAPIIRKKGIQLVISLM